MTGGAADSEHPVRVQVDPTSQSIHSCPLQLPPGMAPMTLACILSLPPAPSLPPMSVLAPVIHPPYPLATPPPSQPQPPSTGESASPATEGTAQGMPYPGLGFPAPALTPPHIFAPAQPTGLFLSLHADGSFNLLEQAAAQTHLTEQPHGGSPHGSHAAHAHEFRSSGLARMRPPPAQPTLPPLVHAMAHHKETGLLLQLTSHAAHAAHAGSMQGPGRARAEKREEGAGARLFSLTSFHTSGKLDFYFF